HRDAPPSGPPYSRPQSTGRGQREGGAPVSTTPLATRHCVPCHGGTPPVQPEQAQALLAELPEWRLEDGKLTRTFPFPSMAEAARFAVRIAELADAEDHHP